MITIIIITLILVWIFGAYSAYNAHKELRKILGMRNRSKRWIRLVMLSWIAYMIIKTEENGVFNR